MLLGARATAPPTLHFSAFSQNSIMSKFILSFGFGLSVFMLVLGLFFASKPNPLVLLLWAVILLGSGYKLFFAAGRK